MSPPSDWIYGTCHAARATLLGECRNKSKIEVVDSHAVAFTSRSKKAGTLLKVLNLTNAQNIKQCKLIHEWIRTECPEVWFYHLSSPCALVSKLFQDYHQKGNWNMGENSQYLKLCLNCDACNQLLSPSSPLEGNQIYFSFLMPHSRWYVYPLKRQPPFWTVFIFFIDGRYRENIQHVGAGTLGHSMGWNYRKAKSSLRIKGVNITD